MTTRRVDPEVRFWAKVDRDGSMPDQGDPLVSVTSRCWRWTGCLKPTGYGTFWDGDRKVHAHRYAYESQVGPIPEGMQIDHLCRNRGCVRPDHLEAVTPRENVLRGDSPGARAVRTDRCDRGHSSNWYVIKDGRRYCRDCARGWARPSRRRTIKRETVTA